MLVDEHLLRAVAAEAGRRARARDWSRQARLARSQPAAEWRSTTAGPGRWEDALGAYSRAPARPS